MYFDLRKYEPIPKWRRVLTAKTFKGKHKTLTGTSRVVGDGGQS